MKVTTIGLDLAKNVFQVHGICEDGEVAFNRALRRTQMLPFFERLDPCLVGIEACGTSHHWARELIKLGHNVKLILSQRERIKQKTIEARRLQYRKTAA